MNVGGNPDDPDREGCYPIKRKLVGIAQTHTISQGIRKERQQDMVGFTVGWWGMGSCTGRQERTPDSQQTWAAGGEHATR
eukprot:7413737-Pyramimonas_sp.AAC.1